MSVVQIIAHRGASWIAPENTLAALRLAWEKGADAAEGDFHLTSDGYLVLVHDATCVRTAGKNIRISETTLDELRRLDFGAWKGQSWVGERIATLPEVLAEVPPGKKYYIELKCGPQGAAALAAAVAPYAHRYDDLAVISFCPDVLTAVKSRVPQLMTFLIVEFQQSADEGWQPTIKDTIELARASQFDGLDLQATGPLDRAAVEQIKSAGLEVCVWTVDSPTLASRLIDAGIDRITTNRPGWLRAQLTA